MNVVTGDVVEVDLTKDSTMETITAMVLLATPEAVILDPLDGSVPFVVYPEVLANARVFDGSSV